MDKRIDITGTTFEELKMAISLAYAMFLDSKRKECSGITAFHLFPNTNRYTYGKEEREEIEKHPIPELHLYSTYDKKDGVENFPCKMSSDTIANMVWEWLDTQSINHNIDMDGSLGRGWNLTAENSMYYLDDHPVIVVKFETMVYGK